MKWHGQQHRGEDQEERYKRGAAGKLYTGASGAQSDGATSPPSYVREFTKTVISVMIGAPKNHGERQSAMPFAPTLPFSFMTKEETDAFFAAIPAEKIRDRLVLNVMYYHSLRRREATLIRLEHIKRGQKRWEIGITRLKRGESRFYPMFPSTKRLLLTYLAQRGEDDNPYLFPSRQRQGQAISGATIYALYRRYAEAAGLPRHLCHPHTLRHSSPTHQLNAGADLVDVKDAMGHRSIASTTKYAQVTDTRRRKHYERIRASKEMAEA
jgi:site-specific recombinase XerD